MISGNDVPVVEMGHKAFKKIADELVTAVRSSATIDWNLRDSVKAAMRSKIRRLLAKYDYPPDREDKAIELVLQQAELFAANGEGAA
jgi:type I restriction enzyme R subunit